MKYLLRIILIVLFLDLFAFGQSVNKIDKQKVYVIGHAHMDPVYRWRWNEIRDREIYNTFNGVLNALDKYPDLHFAQSSMLYYYETQRNFPELFEKIKLSIKDKRWSVVGGQWVESEEVLPSGESIIRQFLIANDYYSKNLNVDKVDIAWAPDIFTGHPVTLPKIYAGCGIKNYLFSRSPPEDKRIFWWESKDGSRILGYKVPGHYNPDYRKLPKVIEEWTNITGYTSSVNTIGKGDHGGGPDDDEMEILKKLENNSYLEFEHISPEKYFMELHASGMTWPIQNNEFGIDMKGDRWKGCYTSQAGIKKKNRFLENQLITAEKFLTIGTMHKGKPFYPREDFKDAWRILLFNQFHNILPGTLAGLGVNDVYKDYNELEEISSELLNAGLENIGNRINTQIEGIPLVVYNPHSWPVSQMVETTVKFVKNTHEFYIKDSSGSNVPYSIIEKSDSDNSFKISIDAKDIPALGYKVFEVSEGKYISHTSDLKTNNNTIENSYYRIIWDNAGLVNIFSKKHNSEVLKGSGNVLKLLEDNGNSWNLGVTEKEFETKTLKEPEVIFSSHLKIVLKWEDYHQRSKFIRYMTVYADSEQLDFELEIDWHGSNQLLKVQFPTTISDGKAYYDQPYGYVERQESIKDVPAQKWVDYSNNDYGIALMNNGKYGFSINESILSMSVIRGAREMDPRMDEGKHSFKYSIIFHDGDWRKADIPLRAWEFNQPLIAKLEHHHIGNIAAWKYREQSFPLEKSFFGINSDHVIISSLKTKQDAYDPNPLILRIVETEGRDEYISVNLPYKAVSVKECNHLEQEIEPRSEINLDEKQFSFKMGHDQIRTFMIQFE